MQTTQAVLTGNIPKLILRSAAPSTAAMLAGGACTLLDALLLARAGTAHASAAAAGYPVLTLMQTIGFTLGTGAGSFVSRSLGGGSRENALRAASTAFFLSLLLSGALCALGCFFSVPLSRLLGADEGTLASASLYIRYVLLSGPLLCANLVLSSLLRAQAQTLANMIAYVLGCLVGGALQFALIGAMNLGVLGSGVAMLAREAVVLLALSVFILRRGGRMRPRIGLCACSRAVLADIMRSGTPTLVRQGMMSLSAALASRSAAAFGSAALAGVGLATRAAALVSSAVIGFGQGFQPVCGIAFGAGNTRRVYDAYRFCQRFLFFALLMLGAAVFLWAKPLLALFSPEQEAAAIAAFSLRAQSAVFFAQGAVIMMNMLTQSMGLTARASLIATSRQGYVLIPLLLILPRLLGLSGLLICQSVSDVLSLLICLPLTRSVTRSLCEPCGYSRVQTASR